MAGEQVDHDDLNEWGGKNVGWGNPVAPMSKTSAQGSITTIADVTSLSGSITALSGRQYMAIAEVYTALVSGGTAGDVFTITIANGSNTVLNTAQITGITSNGGDAISTVVIALFTGSGAVTVKVRGARKSGSGTWQVYGDGSGNASNLTVLDIGPTSI